MEYVGRNEWTVLVLKNTTAHRTMLDGEQVDAGHGKCVGWGRGISWRHKQNPITNETY